MSTRSGDESLDAIVQDYYNWESEANDVITSTPRITTDKRKVDLIIQYIKNGWKILRRFADWTISGGGFEFAKRRSQHKYYEDAIEITITDLRKRLKSSDFSDEKYCQIKEECMSTNNAYLVSIV